MIGKGFYFSSKIEKIRVTGTLNNSAISNPLLLKKRKQRNLSLNGFFPFFILLSCNRLSPSQSYFDVLPPPVSAYTVQYSKACVCKPNAQHEACDNAFNVAFPTLTGQKTSPMFLCDRHKRDIHFSDELTDEDFNLFKRALPSRKRHKREAGRISKENATYHCEERISKTKIGKLCEKIGIDVQALVNACSFDVEVNYLRSLLAEIEFFISYFNVFGVELD